MSVRRFTITHNCMLYGSYPTEIANNIDKLSVEVVKISPFKEKVTFTIDNDKEEDFFVICYELGSLTQSIIWARDKKQNK